MRFPTKSVLLGSLAALGLAASSARAATVPLPYTYSFLPGSNGYIEQLLISDPFNFSLTNVSITESLLSDPTVNGTTSTFLDGVTPLTIGAGQSIAADTGANLPNTFALPFGPQPQNTLFDPQNGPLPFVVSATATGNGQTFGFSFTQTYTPQGTPTSLAAVPEPAPVALLAAGLGLLGVAGLRRRLS